MKFDQVDAVLAEDHRTVLLYGYDRGKNVYVASITMPCAISEDAFIPDEWRAVENVQWRLVAVAS